MELGGKVAIVTGASRGIGRAIAIALAGAGADVMVNYAGRIDAASEVVLKIESFGRRGVSYQANVSDAEQVERMVKTCVEKFGRVDILVNNAGVARDNLVMRLKEEDWDEVLGINLKSVFNCTKAVSRYMLKAKWGRIINISSVVGLVGNPGQANYAASKAGIIGFTKSVAKELGSRNITVNAVAPGMVTTDMTKALPAEMKEKMIEWIPLRRFGTPEEIAELVVFLAGDRAGYITGQVIVIDGGMTM